MRSSNDFSRRASPSRPCTSPEQLVNTSVSIHRNADDVAFSGRLRDDRWSSLRWYADDEAAPGWLSQSYVLNCFGDDRARYISYVEQVG